MRTRSRYQGFRSLLYFSSVNQVIATGRSNHNDSSTVRSGWLSGRRMKRSAAPETFTVSCPITSHICGYAGKTALLPLRSTDLRLQRSTCRTADSAHRTADLLSVRRGDRVLLRPEREDGYPVSAAHSRMVQGCQNICQRQTVARRMSRRHVRDSPAQIQERRPDSVVSRHATRHEHRSRTGNLRAARTSALLLSCSPAENSRPDGLCEYERQSSRQPPNSNAGASSLPDPGTMPFAPIRSYP